MTILVAYVARPEGQAALDKGIEIATRRNEPLVVVNAGPGGKDDPGVVDGNEGERLAERLAKLPVPPSSSISCAARARWKRSRNWSTRCRCRCW